MCCRILNLCIISYHLKREILEDDESQSVIFICIAFYKGEIVLVFMNLGYA